MITNKQTYARVERLTIKLKNELQGFHISKFARELEVGVLDVPAFGIRFKMIDGPHPDDDTFQVIYIPNDDHIDSDKFFLILASKGYIHWLRQKTDSHTLFRVLDYKERWKKLIEAGIEKAKEDKKGEYILSYYSSFLRRSLMEVYHTDPSIFDWLVK